MANANKNKNIAVTQGFIDKLIDKISNILKEQRALSETDEEQAEAIESLLDKISSIERDFEQLTKSLAQGSYPLELARSIRVAPATIKPQIVSVAIAKSQLISTYNEIPSLLSGYINPVNLTPESYRSESSNGIILETTIKGNYWAIATLENKQHQYWLLPNSNITFNIHKLTTVENLFLLKGDYDSLESEFILQEPAVISLLPDNKQWKLIQPGVLVFGGNLKSASHQLKPTQSTANVEQSKIEREILSNLAEFKTEVAKLNSKVSQLEIQSEIAQKTYEREQQAWLSEKESLNRQLGGVAELKCQLSNFKSKVVGSFSKYEQDFIEDRNNNHAQNDRNSSGELQEATLHNEVELSVSSSSNIDGRATKIELKTKISQFRRDYTKDKKLIYDLLVAKVSISVDTLAQITFHQPDVIVLENASQGKYWIIDYWGSHFLIPSEIEHITKAKETSLTVAKSLFDLVGYYPQYSSYHLIRPAVVTKLSSNRWKLQAKGKFNFS